MKKRLFGFLSLALCLMLLSGCAEMVHLSAADEERVVTYAAGLINRFNKTNSRGIVPVVMRPEEELAEEILDEMTRDDDDGFPPDPYDVNAPVGEGGVSNLTEIIDIRGITFTYKETNVSKDYGLDEGILLSPMEGNSYVTVTFNVKNTTAADIECDILNKGINFTAKLEGVVSAADKTFLLKDLTTYRDTIKAGETKSLAVIFQFPTSLVSDLSSLEVSCIREGVKYQLTL